MASNAEGKDSGVPLPDVQTPDASDADGGTSAIDGGLRDALAPSDASVADATGTMDAGAPSDASQIDAGTETDADGLLANDAGSPSGSDAGDLDAGATRDASVGADAQNLEDAGPMAPPGLLLGFETYVANNRDRNFRIELNSFPTDLPNASVLVVAMTFVPAGNEPVEMALHHNDAPALPLLEPGRRFQSFYIPLWMGRNEIELRSLTERFSGLHVAAYLLQDMPLERIMVRAESVPEMAIGMPIENAKAGDLLVGNVMAGSQALPSLDWNGSLDEVLRHVVRDGETSALMGQRPVFETPVDGVVFVQASHFDPIYPFIDLVVAHLQLSPTVGAVP